MRECDIWGLVMLLKHIDEAVSHVKGFISEDAGSRDELVPPDGLKLFVEPILLIAQVISEKLMLQSTRDRVWHGGGAFDLVANHLTWQGLLNELTVLRQAIESDSEKHLFIQVLPDKAQLVTSISANWEMVWKAIPEAKTDIVEAIYCYALERNTACVFHSMRIAEWGLRAFCSTLGFTGVKATKKNGQVKVTPIAFATWDTILSQLRPYAKDKSDRVRNLVRKQKTQEFYYSAISEIEGFKDAWRNHVMHTRRSYTEEDALAVLTHVHRFMRLLVSNGVVKP